MALRSLTLVVIALAAGWIAVPTRHACAEESIKLQKFQATDTLAPAKDELPDAQKCIDGLIWQPTTFEVTCEEVTDKQFDRFVRFPTSVPSGDRRNDRVALEWYAAHGEDGGVKKAPAMLVVHESGSAMICGKLFARGFQSHGIHAFMIQLPYYGERRTGVRRPDIANLVLTMRQAVADVRRARDAIAALPNVDTTSIGVQGTSLGGFVTTTAASLDGCFSNVFVMLAGGNLFDVVNSGQKDAAKVRQLLADKGYTDQKLRTLLGHIEPLRVAHRLNCDTTWLYVAEQDTVVPIKNARALADSARLDDSHFVRFLGSHYTAIGNFPVILEQVARITLQGNSNSK